MNTTNGALTLAADTLTLAYDEREVSRDLSVVIPPGRITAVVGANACGKSTLLRALARLLKPKHGTVLLDGDDINRLPTRDVARRLGILPQTPSAPSGIAVTDLIARGRYPHQRLVRQWTDEDETAVAAAMLATSTLELARRDVDTLSGGQRQRVWIALALAQDTEILLLDEPTTFLDLAHQIDVLDLLAELNRDPGRTIVLVVHDLNHAARYAHHLIAMHEGAICAQGAPCETVTEALVAQMLGMDCRVIEDPVSNTPMVIPIGRIHANGNSATPQPLPQPEGQPALTLTIDAPLDVAPDMSMLGSCSWLS
ncbi:MAG: ABC transporter ATP-binding protein [Chloroflexi bacterium]|nr:ABC transporter ATP-binding protein [Chloroflexota bacterium]